MGSSLRQHRRSAVPVPGWGLAAALAVGVGYLAHWIVFEQDVFWQVRLGREIWLGAPVQSVDSWSYTARGAPFFNFEWLATVVDYLMTQVAPGYVALGWLRSALVGVWTLTLGLVVLRVTRPTAFRWLLVPALVGSLYLMVWFRLQMRPDLWAACCFALWLHVRERRLAWRTEKAWGIAILVAWANFHGGTVPVGIFVFVTTLCLDGDRARTPIPHLLAWCLLALATWFATPIGVNVFQPLLLWLRQSPHDFHNPDYQGFSLSLFDYRSGGYGFRLWAIYTLLGAVALYRRCRAAGPWLRGERARVVIAVVLTLAAAYRLRMIHYQVTFLLPLIAAYVDGLAARAGALARAVRWSAAGVTALLWVFLLPDLSANISAPRGEGISDVYTPVGSVAFIRRERPLGRLLNAYEFGGYVAEALPQYPLAVDGRELPFTAFRLEMDEALRTGAYRELLWKYDVNVVLERLPKTVFGKGGVAADGGRSSYPVEDWALVYFDNVSVVYVRRVPRHEALLRRHEYRYLQRGIPAGHGAHEATLSEAERRGWETDLDRCLATSPENIYCLLGKAAFHQRRGQDGEALALARRAERVNPREPSVYVFLHAICERLADREGRDQARRRFARLTGQTLGG